MTDKAKIRAEVEKRYRENKADGYSDVCEELWDILSFIDTMQEEPVSNPIDFEQELYKAFGQVKDFTLCMRIAKWFYDIGKNSREPVSEKLEDYINELSKQFPEVSFAKLSRIAVRVAKWQKKKMMAKATDAVVSQVPCSNEIILYNPSSVDRYYLPQEMNKLGLNKGDKVKMVIIKED